MNEEIRCKGTHWNILAGGLWHLTKWLGHTLRDLWIPAVRALDRAGCNLYMACFVLTWRCKEKKMVKMGNYSVSFSTSSWARSVKFVQEVSDKYDSHNWKRLYVSLTGCLPSWNLFMRTNDIPKFYKDDCFLFSYMKWSKNEIFFQEKEMVIVYITVIA